MKFEKINNDLFKKFDQATVLNTNQVTGGEKIKTESFGGDCIDDTCCDDGTTGTDIYIGSCC